GITVKMVAAGAEHTVAITEDGDLYGWGWGRYGNLGLGDRKDRNIPEKVSIISARAGWAVAQGTIFYRGTISLEAHLILFAVESTVSMELLLPVEVKTAQS
ncbi:ultraviolet-B receptor UVR8, partial [Tanacetum coccineum]